MAALLLLFQVCPLCAANLGKDVIGHFMVQHESSLKVIPSIESSCGKINTLITLSMYQLFEIFTWKYIYASQHRRKSKNSGFWPGITGTLGKELSSFLASPTGGSKSTHESLRDPFLSPFLSLQFTCFSHKRFPAR